MQFRVNTWLCMSSNSSKATALSDISFGVSFKFSSKYIRISVVHRIKASSLFSGAGKAACCQYLDIQLNTQVLNQFTTSNGLATEEM